MSPGTEPICGAATLSRLFPFHLLLSDDLTVIGAGAALLRLMPAVVGRPFDAQFRVTRPEVRPLSFHRLASLENVLTTVQVGAELTLQGQFEPLANGALLFACSLSVTDTETLSRLGLTVRDFPPHDSAGDYLLLLQSTKTNLADLKGTTSALRAERAELRRVHAQLEAALVASRASEKLLGDSERRYKNVVDTVKEVIFQTDAEGRWTFLNPAWTETLGYSVAESLGKRFLDYVHPDDRDRNVQAFVPLLQKQKDYCRHEVRYVTATGESRWIEVFARLLLDDTGVAFGTAGTLNDVTDHHIVLEHLTESHRALERSKALADAANQAKSDFLASMSHEIRTPLHTLLGMTDLLVESPISPEQQRLVRSVRSSADVLKCLVSDLLDLAKIEQQQMDLHPTPFSPSDLVESVAELVVTRSRKDLEVICAIAPELPVSVQGDAARIRQILLNLASNAVKFTERGEVVIAADFERSAEAAGVLRLSVTDTGIGIPLEEQSQIFERFRRASNSSRVDGTGLGLYVSRLLIERMGGEIRLSSTPGQGSQFLVSIPCDVLRPAVAAAALGEAGPVLIVSPSAATRDALTVHLKAAGHPVVTAESAEAAAAALRRGAFGVVLLDRRCAPLPGALSISARVVNLRRFGDVTPSATGSSLEMPARAAALLAAVRGEQPAFSSLVGAAPAKAAARRATILVVEDNVEAQEFASIALGSAGHDVDIAPTGAAAIARVAQRRYDLILMDLQLPDLPGVEVTRRIRTAEREAEDEPVPIVAVTAHAMAKYEGECLAAGMDAYLTKPLSGGQLRGAVARWADTRKAVVVADDSTDSQLLARRALAKIGLRTVPAHNGVEALRQVARQSVVAAIIDMKMPVMDGLATLRAMCARPDGRLLPVIVLSGVEDGVRRSEMMSLGCAAYLVKPVDATTLSQAVLAALDSGTLNSGNHSSDIEDIPDDLADLMPGYLTARYQDVTDARSAVAGEDFERVQSIGHNMKGTGSSYGFPAISRLGRALEQSAGKRDATQIMAILADLDDVLSRVSSNPFISATSKGRDTHV